MISTESDFKAVIIILAFIILAAVGLGLLVTRYY